MPFIGRQRELARIADEQRRIGPREGRFIWIQGRRRIGKSRLVEEYLSRSGIRSAYYQAPRRAPDVALRRFAETVAESSAPAADMFAAGVSFDSWPGALRAAAEGASAAEPVALIIDELPYLIEKDEGFAADLQQAWDRHLKDMPVLLIAIGSDVRMMNALVAHPAELHGRPTCDLAVPPLSPAEVADLTGTTGAEALDIHLVVGGFPQLAASWPKEGGQRQFLQQALADSATQFVVNGQRILDAELEAGLQARGVLESIGHGECTFGHIREKSGVANETTLTTALDLLVNVKQIVEQSRPYAAPPGSKNTRYTVKDPYMRFWLRFIGPNVEEIDRGRADLAIARIQRDWDTFRGKAIEPLVRSSIERLLVDPDMAARLDGARYVGGYWTRNNQVEVDLVGASEPKPKRVSFLGSVKWRSTSRFSGRDTRELAEQRTHVPGAGEAKLLGVSRSGFTADVALDVQLGPEEIVNAWR